MAFGIMNWNSYQNILSSRYLDISGYVSYFKTWMINVHLNAFCDINVDIWPGCNKYSFWDKLYLENPKIMYSSRGLMPCSKAFNQFLHHTVVPNRAPKPLFSIFHHIKGNFTNYKCHEIATKMGWHETRIWGQSKAGALAVAYKPFTFQFSATRNYTITLAISTSDYSSVAVTFIEYTQTSQRPSDG